MKKLFSIYFILIFSIITGNAQNIDSLINISNTSLNDSSKVKALNEISEIYVNTNLDSAIYYAKEAWRISKLNEYEYGLARSSFNLGKTYEYMAKYLLAIDKLESAIILFDTLGLEQDLAEANKHLGIVYEAQGKYNQALPLFLNALKINEKLENKAGIASCMNSIGLIYFYQNEMPKALEIFNENLKLVEELKYDYAIGITLNNIGQVYEKFATKSGASERSAKLDTALTFYNRALEIHEKSGNLYDMAMVYNNIANTFFYQIGRAHV